MNGTRRVGLVCLLLSAAVAAGCKQKESTEAAPLPARPAPAPRYFHTLFQSECQFIVEAIVSDLAEQVVYAASHRLPDPQHFSVTATEKPGSPQDAPVYDLQVRLGQDRPELQVDLNVNGPIWSPAVYQGVVEKLAAAAGLRAHNPGKSEDAALLPKLSDSTAETIEKENQELSAALERDFTNPELHERAGLLLGAFLLREHSGDFFDIRSPLSRITAHLATARFLRGGSAESVEGRMGEAVLLSLVGDQAPALALLDGIGTNTPATAPMVRALRTRNSGDYRPLSAAEAPSHLESVQWFASMADYAGMTMAWEKLSQEQKQTIDVVRVANELGYSVEIGHVLLGLSVPLEQQEIESVYELYHHQTLAREALVGALNELPERCFHAETNGAVHVRVIGWGQWATFLQRHLCHAIQQNFYFINRKWGVPDSAKEFAAKCDEQFGALRLYPFVRRFNCTDVKSYHESVDQSLKVTVATPHLVPAGCWNSICYKVRFAPLYVPNSNPHINEWHSHNPPPGTVYDLNPRLEHPSLVNRSDAVARFEKLHELAPYDCRITRFILSNKFKNQPTYEQAMAFYGPMLPYALAPLRDVAAAVRDKPERYEGLMLQAAGLNPNSYYDLANYAIERKKDDKAAEYLEKACAADPDAVNVASWAEWRVRYYLNKRQTDKAREIADQGADVYSYRGLEAKAVFLEATTNYAEAFDWYAKIEERYKRSSPLMDFCLRYKGLTGDTRFDPEVERRIDKLFPKGIERVSLNDLRGPPKDGVLIKEENALLKSTGLGVSNVIVAVHGVRVHNFQQYVYGRESKSTPELDLLVWQGDAYREFKPSPPHHRFGVEFVDYAPKESKAQ